MADEHLKQEREGLRQIKPLEVKIVEGGSGGGGYEVVGLKDTNDVRINPAKEDGNLAEIKTNTDKLDVLLSTRASETTLSAIKARTDKIPDYPAREDGNLKLIQEDIFSLLQVLKQLVQTSFGRLAIDSAGRIRIIIDASGTATPVTISSGGIFPVDQRWEIIQRANIEYAECQRQNFTFS